MKNKAKLVSLLLTIGAVLETAAGLGFICLPQGSHILLGAHVNAAGEFVARLAGGGLLGLAIACWFARKSPEAPASLGAFLGLLAYNIVGCATLGLATQGVSNGVAMTLIGAIVHGVLAVMQFIVLLARNGTEFATKA